MISEESNKIHFHFLVSCSLKDRGALKTFIVEILRREGKKLETINFIFCSDKYLLSLNQEFLKHNTLTDIITFEYSKEKDALASDIFISVDRVRANTVLFKTTFKRELHRVVFHGILHLCGYKDKKQAQQILMREKEDYYLSRYFDTN